MYYVKFEKPDEKISNLIKKIYSIHKKFLLISEECNKVFYPEKYIKKDERTWIERKYPTTYPSLSDDFRKFERGCL